MIGRKTLLDGMRSDRQVSNRAEPPLEPSGRLALFGATTAKTPALLACWGWPPMVTAEHRATSRMIAVDAESGILAYTLDRRSQEFPS